jgi:hypothetical protein
VGAGSGNGRAAKTLKRFGMLWHWPDLKIAAFFGGLARKWGVDKADERTPTCERFCR